jgi:hypothetical protein
MIISGISSDPISRVFGTCQEILQNAVIWEGTPVNKCCISAYLRFDKPNVSLRFRFDIKHLVHVRTQFSSEKKCGVFSDHGPPLRRPVR